MSRGGNMSDMRTNDELLAEQLRIYREFRAEWERTSVGRAVATAIVRYRAELNPSQRDLAECLGVSPGQGCASRDRRDQPSTDKLMWLSAQLGIEPHIDAEPSAPAH